jgi:hypothetical protein
LSQDLVEGILVCMWMWCSMLKPGMMCSFECEPKKHKASLIGPMQKTECILELTISSAISLHRQTKVWNELMKVLCVMWRIPCEGANRTHQMLQQLDSDHHWHVCLTRQGRAKCNFNREHYIPL